MDASKRTMHLDLRIIIALLLAVIAAMLLLWRPWSQPNDDRTVQVSGEATIMAAPDEFVFYPAYDFKGSDREAALSQLTAKSDEVVKRLKDIGVQDSKIKTNSSGYESVARQPEGGTTTYRLQLTITVDDRALAQKVQDYLVTTSPVGSVSPHARFSDNKRKELESKGRDQATKDARSKAEQMAKSLGFRVGKVRSIDDGAGFGGGIEPFDARGMAAEDTPTTTQLQLQPGESELPYNVRVTYYIR